MAHCSRIASSELKQFLLLALNNNKMALCDVALLYVSALFYVQLTKII